MRTRTVTITLLFFALFFLSLPHGEGRGGRWNKVKMKLLAWPKKGAANRLPAYRLLTSPKDEFLNFSFAPSDRYRITGEKLTLLLNGKTKELEKAGKAKVRLSLPDGRRETAAFEFFPPEDGEHWSSEGDKLQWKMRNERACAVELAGMKILLFDSDCDGCFFTFGADKMVQLGADEFSKGDFDPADLKPVPFEWYLQAGEDGFFLLAPVPGGMAAFELPEGTELPTARALGYLNWMRWQGGAPPVYPDEKISDLLAKHCAYCAAEGVSKGEKKDSPHFDAAAARAAGWAFTCRAATPVLGVRAALCTVYHRNMLLWPKVRSIGFAFDKEKGIFCIGGVRKAWEADFEGVCPFRGQRGVLLRNYPEEPSPLREGEENFAGTCVSLRAPEGMKLVSAELLPLSGEALNLSVSTPDSPPPAAAALGWKDNRKGIVFLPEEPLQPGRIYKAKVKLAGDKGEERTIEWMFMTEERPIR